MPCRDDYPCSPEPDRNAVRVEQLTALLCSACEELNGFGFNFDLNPELSRWWDGHKKKDQKRKDQELKEQLERERVRHEMERALDLSKNKKISDLTKTEIQLLKKYKIL